ncbi:MAG: hypothetical protein Q7T59_05610 [Candidatus Woesebacteria bacterium]|nr:hypothetical protein [Candidatus Woesebacteria bacterium]
MISNEAKKWGRPKVLNRQGLYSKASKHAVNAIERIAELMNSKNENISLGASRTILDKCLPSLRPIEQEQENRNITIKVVSEDKPFFTENEVT